MLFVVAATIDSNEKPTGFYGVPKIRGKLQEADQKCPPKQLEAAKLDNAHACSDHFVKPAFCDCV